MKSVLVLLLNMCNTLELSAFFVCLGDLLSFLVPGGQKKLLGYGLTEGDQYSG